MNSNICDNCNNFMFTYIDAEKTLYNLCKRCGNNEKTDKNCVYQVSKNIDKSKILNEYTHIMKILHYQL